MHPPGSNRENEIKLRVESAAAGASMLTGAGFHVERARAFEDNIVYDTPDLRLRSGRSLVRIRQAAGKATLTFKGPPEPGPHKSREEIETDVKSAAAMDAILGRLGFQPVFRYQKYRSEWRRGDGGGIAMLDETPIGYFVELEGPPDWVDRTAAALGYSPEAYITASYAAIYFQWCQEHGSKPGDMVFG